LSVYFDASVIVSMVTADAFTNRAEAYLLRDAPLANVSDLAAAEVVAALGARLRRRELDVSGANRALGAFDAWRASAAEMCVTIPEDVAAAEMLLRRFELALRAPDAIHLAIVRRKQIPLVTFDVRMADAARTLGLEVADA
jgi:hypothetical protein